MIHTADRRGTDRTAPRAAERVSVAIHMRTEVATPVVDYPNPYVTMQYLDGPRYCPVLYGKL